ncbi:MAG: flavin reductase [Desulfobacteraceae bacterium]|nr:flavin reductase [Desulfobacteraceae bacterium]
MLVLGLQGSPRLKSNTNFLLSTFLDEAEKLGARTHLVHVDQKNILPCKEYVVCEKKGYCPIHDDMETEIYALLREADIVVAATPIFFYNTTAQLKALIDRSQTLWARKYRLNLTDPNRNWRKGFLLAVGATRGKNLFEGIDLTMKYFFDAVGASYDSTAMLAYRQIEKPGDMKNHPTVIQDVKERVAGLMAPFTGRKKILFACRENACRSQMAGAFAQLHAGDKIEAYTAGSEPAQQVSPIMEKVMAEKGIDMGFRKPGALNQAIAETSPDILVTMGCGENCPFVPGCKREDWNLPDPTGKPIEFMRDLRDKIENKVKNLIQEVSA